MTLVQDAPPSFEVVFRTKDQKKKKKEPETLQKPLVRPLNVGDPVMVKNHAREAWDPKYAVGASHTRVITIATFSCKESWKKIRLPTVPT